MQPNKQHSLGQALLSEGLISEKRLADILIEHNRTGKKLERLFIENEIVSDVQIAKIVADQQNLPFVDLLSSPPANETVQTINERLARKCRAIALQDRNGKLVVGVSDPDDFASQDLLSSSLGRPFDIAIVAESQLNDSLDRYYKSDAQLNEYARAIEFNLGQDIDIFNITRISSTLDDQDAPVVKLLQTIFKQVVQLGVSDIHIEPHERALVIRYRIDGVLHTQMETDIKVGNPLLVRLKLMAGLDISEKRLPLDGRIGIRGDNRRLDIRLSTLPTQHGESAVMRILAQTMGRQDLDSMNMPADELKRLRKAIHMPNGIVLATGPTGSGKTTTLYGALYELNQPEVKILTAEDPVEYTVFGINQVQVNEKIELTFPKILRSFLRQDPDVILVGEIRDSETADIAVRAAMTGHMVLSSLHTNDSASAPARLMDMGVPAYLIAGTLRLVMSQRLARAVCPSCAAPHQPDQEQLAFVKLYFDLEKVQMNFMRGSGCDSCSHTGYRGRVGIYEMLEINQHLASALHSGNPMDFERMAREHLADKSLAHNALRLAMQGRTTLQEAIKNIITID